MPRSPLTDLPFWPRLLSRDEAARYVGVCSAVFDEEAKRGNPSPQPCAGAAKVVV